MEMKHLTLVGGMTEYYIPGADIIHYNCGIVSFSELISLVYSQSKSLATKNLR